MNQELEIMSCHSIDGATWTLIISGLQCLPLTNSEVAECLREYALFLERTNDEIRN